MRANVFTRFNAILGAMLAVILVVGPIQDGTFGLVLVANSLIGIVQEMRAKRTLDQLAVLSAPRARVDPRRAGRPTSRSRRSCSTTCSSCASATRSPATGRPRRPRPRGRRVAAHRRGDPIEKARGDEVLSGSFVVAGVAVGSRRPESAPTPTRRARDRGPPVQLTRSELMEGINTILRYVSG